MNAPRQCPTNGNRNGMGRVLPRSLVRVIVESRLRLSNVSRQESAGGQDPLRPGVLGADSRAAGARALSWRRHRPGDPHPVRCVKRRGARPTTGPGTRAAARALASIRRNILPPRSEKRSLISAMRSSSRFDPRRATGGKGGLTLVAVVFGAHPQPTRAELPQRTFRTEDQNLRRRVLVVSEEPAPEPRPVSSLATWHSAHDRQWAIRRSVRLLRMAQLAVSRVIDSPSGRPSLMRDQAVRPCAGRTCSKVNYQGVSPWA